MRKFAPVIVFAVAALLGGLTSWFAYKNAVEIDRARMESIVDNAIEAISSRLTQHLSLLDATRAYFDAQGEVPNRADFRTFVDVLDLDGVYDGIQGIGFAPYLTPDERQSANDRLARNYGPGTLVFPDPTDLDHMAPIVLLEPLDSRNERAIGFDMFSETVRRTGMIASMLSEDAHATGPVELVQENDTDPQHGFLVYLPYRAANNDGVTSDDIDGFIYAPFRIGDLVAAALPNYLRLPVVVDVFDVTDGPDSAKELLRSSTPDMRNRIGYEPVVREVEMAGRKWQYVAYPSEDYPANTESSLAILTGLFSLLLAAALGGSAFAQNQAHEASMRLANLRERSLAEKELILGEMKHRIKNSISRIMAIARQSARTAEDKDEFIASFIARLQAMSHAQDMLTRSHWSSANLAELLRAELDQISGDHAAGAKISGPDIEVNAKTAQALALVFHELATNAAKYHQHGDDDKPIEVSWGLSTAPQSTGRKRRRRGKSPESAKTAMGDLRIEWQEMGSPVKEPETKGFGTKLVDANVKGELGGQVERYFTDQGFRIVLTIPDWA